MYKQRQLLFVHQKAELEYQELLTTFTTSIQLTTTNYSTFCHLDVRTLCDQVCLLTASYLPKSFSQIKSVRSHSFVHLNAGFRVPHNSQTPSGNC